MAQLDAHPTGVQEVAGSTPARSAAFFRGDLIMKYFLWSFSPAASRRAVVRFWQKNVHNILVIHSAFPVNVWLGKLNMLDMTLLC